MNTIKSILKIQKQLHIKGMHIIILASTCIGIASDQMSMVLPLRKPQLRIYPSISNAYKLIVEFVRSQHGIIIFYSEAILTDSTVLS